MFVFAESFESPAPWSGWATGVSGYAWSQHSGSTLSPGTGPSESFAGSYYMYTEASIPRMEGDVFDLRYRCMGPMSVAAVEFWYHMHGDGMGTLRLVSGAGVVSWEKSGDQGDSWQRAYLHPSSFSPVALFEAIRGPSWSSDVAVDNQTSLLVPEGELLLLGGEELVLDNVSVSIASSGGGAVIDGEGRSRIFKLTNGASLRLSHMRLQGGGADQGGALYLESSSVCMLVSSSISDIEVVGVGFEIWGGAIFANFSDCILVNSSITEVTLSPGVTVSLGLVRGGAVYATEGASIHLTDVTISSFHVSADRVFGGALYLFDSSTASMRGVSVSSFHLSSGNAVYGGALYVDSSSTAVMSEVTISSLHVSSDNYVDGGALNLLSSSTAKMSGVTISSCNVSTGGQVSGGALNLQFSSNASMSKVSISSFTVRARGDVHGGTMRLFDWSHASMSEVAVFSFRVSAGSLVDGGVMHLFDSSNATMSESTFSSVDVSADGTILGGIVSLAISSTLDMSNGSALFAGTLNASEQQGDVICMDRAGTAVTYTFPIPPGSWLPATECTVLRDPPLCPLAEPQRSLCAGFRDELLEICSAKVDEMASATFAEPCNGMENDCSGWWGQPVVPCPNISALQACPVRERPELVGKTVFLLPLDTINEAFPFQCQPGIRGSDEVSEQLSPLCGGLCPAGQGDACLWHHTSSGSPSLWNEDPSMLTLALYDVPTVCSTRATTTPQRCEAGSYCTTGSVVSQPCPAGTYSNTTGLSDMSQCWPCPAGSSCSTGSTAPTLCVPGTVQPLAGQAICEPCEGGTFRTEVNGTSCEACYQGSYCPRGSSAPLPCLEGSFSSATNLMSAKECIKAAPGNFAPTRSVEQRACSAGTFTNSSGSDECTKCEAGTFQDEEGSTDCKACPVGSFCPKGAPNPLGCESGAGIPFAVTQERGSTEPADCVCQTGFFNNTLANRTCGVCPSGTDCSSAGFTLETLPVRPGYYRLNPQSVDVRRCPDAAINCSNDLQCETTTSGCAGGESRTGCHEGLEGAFCRLCTHQSEVRVYYYAATSRARAQCKECPDAVLNLMLILLGSVLAACAGGWLLSCGYRRLSEARKQQVLKAWLAFTVHVKLKIVVGFYLIAGVVDDVYEVQMPPEAQQLLSFFYVCVSFGLSGIEQLLECLDLHSYVARLTSYMLTPPLIGIVIVLLSAGHLRLRGTLSGISALAEFSSPYLLLLLFVTYPIVSRMAFNGFSCYEFTSSAWLKVDVAIQCYTSSHVAAQGLAAAAIVLYPVGLLLLIGALLFKARRPILAEKPTPLSTAISFLYREYKPHMFWWELVEMLRRFVLVGLMVLYQDTMMQLILATLLSAIFLLLQVQASPYRKREDDWLASVSSFCLVVVLMCATAFKYLSLTNLDDIQDRMSIEQRRVYVLGGDMLLVLLIASSIVTLLCSVGIFIVQLAAARIKLLDEDDLAILRKAALMPKSPKSISWASSSAMRVVGRVFQLRRVVVQQELDPERSQPSGRFMASNTLISGKPEEAAFGLMHFMGVSDPFAADGVEKICAEVNGFVQAAKALDEDSLEMNSLKAFALAGSSARAIHSQISADIQEWLEYIMKHPASERSFFNGVRDAGRAPVFFEDFVKHEMAQKAGLDPAHVLALRFYTTHAFKYINGPLRAAEYGRGKRPHPLPITVMFISEGIKRLRAVYAASENATKVINLWRGMKNLKVAEEFMLDQRGGTEVAPMSTTSDLRIAAQYGVSDTSLLFKIKVSNFLQYGAELQWLSAFPGEAEVCYPPLTYLQPTGRTQVVTMGGTQFTVCEVTPHIP
ncbi:MAG: hypothetical protein SGPRY_003115 [Prymnesium sp.]